MANLYEKASLVLPNSPAYKDGAIQAYKPLTSQGTFDFSRGSNLAATRVDVNGLIEKGRENVVLQSNNFSTTWLSTGLNVTSGATDPNGGLTAWTIENTAASGIIQQSVSLTGLRSVSIYAKKGTHRYLRIGAYGGTQSYANFDLQDGAVSSGTKATIKNIGGGWYRCTAWGADGTTGGVQIFPSNNATSASTTNGNIFIWRCQYESGLVATDYIETGASTAQAGILEDLPRLDYSGGASCPSLLLEPQRSNILPSSEYWGTWNTGTNNSYESNATTSPEGLQNASRLYSTGGNGINNHKPLSGLSVGSTYTFSTYLKKHTRNDVEIYIYSISIGNFISRASINFDAGTISDLNGSGSTIEDAGNGWYRCTVKVVCDGSLSFGIYTNSGDTSVYAYGAQAEAGSYPTSYIPTNGSAVTRSADSCSKTGVSDLIGQTEGVVYFEWDYQNVGSSGGNIVVSLAGASLQELYFWVKTDGGIVYDVYDSTKQAGIIGSIGSFGIKKIALAYKNNDFALYINGVLVGSDTSGSVPTLTDIFIGRYAINTNYNISSGINQVLLFKTRLTNAELAALTTL